MKTTITVDPGGEFDKSLSKKIESVKDLRIPFELIRESWFKGNRAIFALKGPGKFADLTERYKNQKQKDLGFTYPILLRTGTLKAALTQPGAPGSIAKLIGLRTLDIGVDESNKVWSYLHYGTKKMKARPYVLTGAEQVAPNELNKRVENWQKLIIDYVLQVTGAKNV